MAKKSRSEAGHSQRPNRIREWRRTKDKTLEWLAAKTDISASELSKLEFGAREPRLEHLLKIGAALEVPPHDLVFQKDWEKYEFGGFRLARAAEHGGSAGAADLDFVPIRGRTVNHRVYDLNRTVGNVAIRLADGLTEDAYAIYNPTDKLGPFLKIGDVLIISPKLRVLPGDLVLIANSDGEGELTLFKRPPGGPGVMVHKVCAILPV